MKIRLGISCTPSHSSPEEWAEKMTTVGVRAVCFPVNHTAEDKVIDAYVAACREHDLMIAEVGAWSNPLSADMGERRQKRAYCRHQLELAEYVGARCCVNIAGTERIDRWDGPAAANLDAQALDKVAESIHEIMDGLTLERTYYTLEPMPWMIPDSPEGYLELLDTVAHPRLGVHMDIVNIIYQPRHYFFNREYLDKAFALLKGRIRSCHLKDIKLADNLTMHFSEVPCGEGNLDIRHYLELAVREDPDMPVLIEHLAGWENYLKSFDYVKGLAED